MHVTACLAGQKVDVEVGEDCRSLQALKEAVVEALPKLCVEGFDVSVGGRALDDDDGVVSLADSVCLDVSANICRLSVRALREAGREVGEEGLLRAAAEGSVALCTLYLDAGVPIDCVDSSENTPLHLSCHNGHLSVARLLLDRRSTAIDEKAGGYTPLHLACCTGHVSLTTLLLDRGSCAIDEKTGDGHTPLHLACSGGYLLVATLLLDRGSTAIDEENGADFTPLHLACCNGDVPLTTLLLDRGSCAIDKKNESGYTPLHLVCRGGHVPLAALLLDRGSCAIDEKNEGGYTPLHLVCRGMCHWRHCCLAEAVLSMRRLVRATHLFITRAALGTRQSPHCCWTEAVVQSMRRTMAATRLFTSRATVGIYTR